MGLRRFKAWMIPPGVKIEELHGRGFQRVLRHGPGPNVSTMIDTGSATPIGRRLVPHSASRARPRRYFSDPAHRVGGGAIDLGGVFAVNPPPWRAMPRICRR